MSTEEKAVKDEAKKSKAKGKAEKPAKDKKAPAPKKADAKKESTKKTDSKKADAKKTKAEKPAKAAGKKAAAEKKPAAERDAFGFRKGSKKSEAAKLYSSKKGATLAEVKEKTGSSQLNLLKELEEKGWEISRTKVGGEGKKQVTRYKIEGEAVKGKSKK